MAEQYANLASTTLSANYTAGDGTATVVSTAGNFPSTFPFHAYVLGTDNIIKVLFKVTNVAAGNKFIVTAEGADANALASSTLRCALTAGAMDQIRQDIHQQGSAAGLPNGGSAGDIYLATDGFFQHRWNGASWDYYYSGVRVTPPVLANFTQATFGSMGFTTLDGAQFGTVSATSATLYHLSGQSKTLAVSSNYTVTLGFIPTTINNSFNEADIVLYDGTGKFITMGLFYAPSTTVAASTSAPQMGLEVITWSNTATLSGAPFSIYLPFIPTPVWLRIVDDGTNRFYKYSGDGRNFLTLGSHTRTTYITPSQVGFGGNALVAANPAGNNTITFIHFSETTP